METYDIIKDILPLLNHKDRFEEVENLLCTHANLPGPRANLTLAFKFADYFEKQSISQEVLELLIRWINILPQQAPTNHPREYLPFCGILALGSYYYYADEYTKKLIINQFEIAMNDTRWRTREGAAMGFQRIAEKDFSSIKEYFTKAKGHWNLLEKRAFIAALAHPPILKDKEVVRFSLEISDAILGEFLILDKDCCNKEEFRVLSKGLEYALSVFIVYLPKDGFELLKKYARFRDPHINKIIKSNLGKARLLKKYPQEVEEVLKLI